MIHLLQIAVFVPEAVRGPLTATLYDLAIPQGGQNTLSTFMFPFLCHFPYK